MALTTASRVRNRLPFSGPPDNVITEFIEDAEAWINCYVGRDIATTDNYYELARALCTHKACVLAVLNRLQDATADERSILLRALDEFQSMVSTEKTALKRA